MPEGEEEEQEIENLFEKIMKENFPNLAKEIDFQEVQEAQRVPQKLDPKRNTTKHIIITLPKIKRKDLHPRLLYPAKLSFRMEGKIKCFSDTVKLKKLIITKPLLYEMLKGVNLRKRRSKIGTVKMTANSQLLTTTPKTKTRAN